MSQSFTLFHSLTCIACGCVERRWPGTVPRERVNRISDPATIWRRPVRMPPAAWRCSRNACVRFDLDRFGCVAPVRFVCHRWSWPGYRWLERPAASLWSWPTGDATAEWKDKERERERIKRLVSSTTSSHTLTWLGQMSSYCICIYLCVVFVVSAAKYAAERRAAQGQGQRAGHNAHPAAAGSSQTASTFAICNSLTGSVCSAVRPSASPASLRATPQCVVQQVTATLRIRRVCAKRKKTCK